MAGIIGQSAGQALQLGSGIRLQPQCISDSTDLLLPPCVVPIFIDWEKYQASSVRPVTIDVDISTISQGPKIDAIRSIYIDNTFSNTPIYVIFNDTGFVVVCPANSTYLGPVWTNMLKCKIFAIGFQDGVLPKTLIHLCNVTQGSAATASGSTLIATPSISFIEHLAGGGGALAQTFANTTYGSTGTSRAVYAVTHALLGTAISGVTIGAVVATLVKFYASASFLSGIYVAIVPAGTLTGNTVVTYTTVPTFSSVDMFVAYNLANNTVPTATRSSADTSIDSSGVAIATLPVKTGIAILGSSDVISTPVKLWAGIANGNGANDSAGLQSSIGYQRTFGGNLDLSYKPFNQTALVCAAFA